MKPEFEKYIGYITGKTNNNYVGYGTCFFIGANKAITAAHTFEDICEPYTLHINNQNYSFGDNDKESFTQGQYAIISLPDSPFPDYDDTLILYNADFRVNRTEKRVWETSGYIIEFGKPKGFLLSGQSCSICKGDYQCVLSEPSPKKQTYRGMSGSPVFINDLLVGILQLEEYVFDTPENLYLTSVAAFRDELPKSAIADGIYNGVQIPKIDYSGNVSENKHIIRNVLNYDDNQVYSFDELFVNLPDTHTYVLTGEAGLGKTEELIRLAVNTPFGFYPVVYSLKSLLPGQTLPQCIPVVRSYIENNVPFFLILDGYDEIRNYSLREEVFPVLLEQLISEINNTSIKNNYYIIVSSRSVFYHKNKFNGFIQLKLMELSKEEIDSQLDLAQVNKNNFHKEVADKSLYSFIKNPFYLFHIIELFKSDNGQLPKSNMLMDSIINQLMAHQNKGVFSPDHQRNARAALRKISACFMLRAFDFNDKADDDLLQMMYENINNTTREWALKTGIVDTDETDNWIFKHNNYYEYLAAEFFNKKYETDIEGLIKLIAYENHKGIFNNFKNMVTYLLLIRETSDLKDWIITNCPDAIESIENHDLTEKMSQERLVVVFEEARKKGYYIGQDFERGIGSIIQNRRSITYLLELLNTSEDTLELYNTIQLIDRLQNLSGMDQDIKDALLGFIISDRGQSYLKQNAFYALCDLNLSDQDMTDSFVEHFLQCTDGDILLGLDRYIYKNDLADRFSENLINQFSDKRLLNHVNMRVYDCLGCFRSVDSMVKLYDAILNKSATDLRNSMLNALEKVLEKNNQSLIKQYEDKEVPDELIKKVLELTLFLLDKCYLRFNAFSGFLNTTKADTVAIRYYFYNTDGKAVVFRLLSKDLNCFTEFLINGYQNQLFVGQKLTHFLFCVRELDKDNLAREQCLEVIRNGNNDDKEDSISYITYNDDFLEKEEKRKEYHKQIIFDYHLFSQTLHDVIRQCEKEDPEFTELFTSVSQKYLYNSIECDTVEYYRSIHFIDKPVSFALDYYEKHKEEWMVITASEFVKKYKDYSTYLGQLHVISDVVRTVLSYARRITDRILLESVIHLMLELKPTVSKETLLDLLYINPYFYPDQSDMRVPDFLKERLSHNEIIEEIERSINAGIPQRYADLACTFLSYCSEYGYKSDLVVSLAESTLNSESDNAFNQAGHYLLTYYSEDILIKNVLNGKISKKRFISFSGFLASICSDELTVYVRSLWHELEFLQDAVITEENLNSYMKKYDYVDLRGEKYCVELFKKAVHECMKNLYYYIFKNNIDNCINNYLDEMISNRTNSKYEPGTFEFLVNEITSTDYLEKMLTVLKIVYDGDFDQTCISNSFSTQMERAMTVMSKNNPDEVISILNPYLTAANAGFRRAVNLIYDNAYEILYTTIDKEYKISEIKEIVFS